MHGLDGSAQDLADALHALTEALGEAVSGSAGFQLTLVHSGFPVTVDASASASGPVRTTMRVPLLLLSAAHEPGGRVTFYSTVPGSFVDLAADLAHALDPAGGEAVELDVDLPTGSADALLTGLEDLATVHRAAGVLIAQGHHPDTVHQDLVDQAAARGLSTLVHARRILGR